jgi:hypothetical protein
MSISSSSRRAIASRPTSQWALSNRTSPRCGTWSRSPFWEEAKRPVPGKFKVQVSAWLLEDFDPGAQPIKVIDGKTLW